MTSRQSGPVPRDGESAPAEKAAASRALVALSPAPVAHVAPEAYRQAPFLAHLLAMKGQHQQTRVRRRVEPNEALAAYGAAVALTRFG